MANSEPFVQTACIAENVLIEADGVPSAIRIVDTFTINEPPNLPPDVKPATVLNVLVTLKSGDLKGQFQIELVLRPPAGPAKSLAVKPIVLEGGIHGAQMRMAVNVLGLKYDDPYWLDVVWGTEKKVLTSIPFRFKRAEPAVNRSEPTVPDAARES